MDLRDKRILSPEEAAAASIDVASFDQRASGKDPLMSSGLSTAEDIASIKRREHYALGYVLRSGEAIEVGTTGPRLWTVVHSVRFYCARGRCQYRCWYHVL